MEQILNQLKQAVGGPLQLDEQARRSAVDTLRDLQYALESPEQTMQRLIYLNLTSASVRVGVDLGIYNVLSQVQEPIKLEDIASRVNADPVLLGRILRHQASLGMLNETGQDTFSANNITRNLCPPEIQAGIRYYHEIVHPPFHSMPEYLAENKYQNPSEFSKSVFHKAFQTSDSYWTFVHRNPQQTADFNLFMKAHRSSIKNCFDYWNVEEASQDWPHNKPIFVDIGGGSGFQCVALRNKFPGLAGRIILQDLPLTVEEAKTPEGIQKMAYDFYTEQPIKGAKFYYFRAVMHDHTDDKCAEILKNQVEAMEPDSRLVLDETVCPNAGIDWYITQVDLVMMTQFSAMERTQAQWEAVLSKVGLEIEQVIIYTQSLRLGLIIAKKA